ncbi:MAG: hypothetical protein UT30_C0003G0001 [Candidatus Uhrbacteria bacterium GW2011_GWF2_39_13]|uniref:Uncharacterized protein n=1 Tax=Candidatus Uhrbacteria bacterium GW2011_GWF2_39_13 TaxID=1618995 RepID=A0A0G0QT77_9BACT|nr:MAG: hypothetical protein UT30_C0003G0001 [Candidatus Uhrbacteria bacterium GW2011_GWF2_39_13]HAU66291.1 hypothetical protein [Candidatus Uhrbacteria bacterium]
MHTDQLKTFFSENERILNLSGFPRLIGMHCAAWLVIDTYLPEKQVFPEIGKEGISCIPGISREDLPAKLAVLRVNRMIGDHLPILIMAIRDIRDS